MSNQWFNDHLYHKSAPPKTCSMFRHANCEEAELNGLKGWALREKEGKGEKGQPWGCHQQLWREASNCPWTKLSWWRLRLEGEFHMPPDLHDQRHISSPVLPSSELWVPALLQLQLSCPLYLQKKLVKAGTTWANQPSLSLSMQTDTAAGHSQYNCGRVICRELWLPILAELSNSADTLAYLKPQAWTLITSQADIIL